MCLLFVNYHLSLKTHEHTFSQKSEAQAHYLPGAVGLSPAQFYVHRDHTLGGSVSRLDRLRTHQELPYMETFAEEEEDEEEEDGLLKENELGECSCVCVCCVTSE